MKKTPIQQAAALLAAQSRINPTPAQQAASRENGKKGAEHGRKGGRPKGHWSTTKRGKARIASYMRRYGMTEMDAIDAITKSGIDL